MSIKNFTAYNPTRLHFGEGVVNKLGKYTSNLGKKALLLYGKGSAVRFGYYDQVKRRLIESGIEVVEYSGIKPNPIIEDVRNASALARNENVDVIVALGGGRPKKGDEIDHAVGISVLKKVGESVENGEEVFHIHASDHETLESVNIDLQTAFTISEEPVEPLPLFYGEIE